MSGYAATGVSDTWMAHEIYNFLLTGCELLPESSPRNITWYILHWTADKVHFYALRHGQVKMSSHWRWRLEQLFAHLWIFTRVFSYKLNVIYLALIRGNRAAFCTMSRSGQDVFTLAMAPGIESFYWHIGEFSPEPSPRGLILYILHWTVDNVQPCALRHGQFKMSLHWPWHLELKAFTGIGEFSPEPSPRGLKHYILHWSVDNVQLCARRTVSSRWIHTGQGTWNLNFLLV